MSNKPAIGMVAPPGRRQRTIDLAIAAEEQGFAGIYCPSLAACIPLCQSILEKTSTIKVGTSIQPIYLELPRELAATSSYLHEVSGGRFSLGLGVTHAPAYARFGITNVGKPLSDMRDYVTAIREAEKEVGELPPIVLATLRSKMLTMATEIADGAVWANAALSNTKKQLDSVPGTKKAGFYLGNMVPTVIDPDKEAARAVHRKTLNGYLMLPNYRNYWRDSGYADEMAAVEASIDKGDVAELAKVAGDTWLDDCTLSGSASEVRDGVEAWRNAGISTPIVVPSSTSGGMVKAIEEVFNAFK